MTALKTITIQYSGGSVSEGTYNSYTSTQKTSYHNYLLGLNSSTYENAQWKISYEIYIPSGIRLQIPQNVTIVADGGLFSGTGTLASNYTKIKAGFEQIFEDTLNFRRDNGNGSVYQWDVKLSHPEWFGVTSVSKEANGDGSTYVSNLSGNDSVKIQKAIDILCAPYSTDWFNFDNFTGILFAGGRIVCKPYSLYNIRETIYLPLGVSLDGGDSNFIYDASPGTYMFKTNLKKDNNPDKWLISERGQMDTISNIKILNPKGIDEAYGIFSASQCCTFKDIQSEHMSQTFKRHYEYIDNLTLQNFTINFGKKSKDNRYQIDINYIGDNLLIDNAAFTYEKNVPTNSIYVSACRGGRIQRITNGTIEIRHSQALTLSNIHQEFGCFILENSLIELDGFCHFKKEGVPAIRIKRQSENRDGEGWTTRPVTIKNGMILYDGMDYDEENKKYKNNFSNELDIKLGWITGAVKIENVFRAPLRGYTEASSLFGIRINNNSFMKNSAANSISSIVNGSSDTSGDAINYEETDRGVMLNNYISHEFKQYGTILRHFFPVTNNIVLENQRYFTPGSYYYYACVLVDRERNIGHSFPDVEQRLIKIEGETASHTILSFYRHYYLGLYIRVFRKKQGSNKIYYIDLPAGIAYNDIVDLGEKTEYGDKWIEVNAMLINNTSDVFDTNNNLAFSRIIPQKLLPQTCNNYQKIGTNVIVKMHEAPDLSKGSWEEGDMIYISNQRKYITI